jgi:type I restriction enzyme R subunit
LSGVSEHHRQEIEHEPARRADRDAINIVYKSLQQDREQADISDVIRQLHEVIDGAIETVSRQQYSDRSVT